MCKIKLKLNVVGFILLVPTVQILINYLIVSKFVVLTILMHANMLQFIYAIFVIYLPPKLS